jgi:hypothetical protein
VKARALIEDTDPKDEVLGIAEPAPVQVSSSHGEFTVNPMSGLVLEFDGDPDDEDYADYVNVTRFDVEEWKRAYPGEEFNGADILDIGCWYRDGSYGGPEEDWRAEIALMRAGDAQKNQ